MKPLPPARLPPRRHRRKSHRRGSILVVVGFAMIVLVAVAGIAIDGQWFRMAQEETQNAAEAAVIAAAIGMDGTTTGLTTAKTRARVVTNVNEAGGVPLDYDTLGGDAAVELGRVEDGVFVADTSDPAKTVAARVLFRNPSFSALSGLTGHSSTAVSAEARVLGGGPAGAECPLPLAIPACGLPKAGDGSYCNVDIQLIADQNDNGSWAQIGSGRPNAGSVRSAIEGCSAISSITDTVGLNNGAISSAAGTLADAISSSPDTWDTAKLGAQPAQRSRSAVTSYGHVLQSQLIIFEPTGAASCTGTKFNGTGYDIVGFATAVVYDTVATGPAAQRSISMRIVCDSLNAEAGGGYFGTRVPPQLF